MQNHQKKEGDYRINAMDGRIGSSKEELQGSYTATIAVKEEDVSSIRRRGRGEETPTPAALKSEGTCLEVGRNLFVSHLSSSRKKTKTSCLGCWS